MYFSYNLSWSTHVEKVIRKSSSIINRIRHIRHTLSIEQCLKVFTSYYYSTIYYGSSVRLGATTTSNDWKLLNKAHYQALRIIMKDYQRQIPRAALDQSCQRVTPRQWSYNLVATTETSIIRNQEPSLLYSLIMNNISTN
jgi:hypothetical protein